MPTAHKVLVKADGSSLSRRQLKSNTSNSSTKEISGSWRKDEHKLFLQGLEQHGRKWKKIVAVVGTRTRGQVQSHAQKYFAKLGKAKTKETNEIGVEEDEPMMFQFHVSWDERLKQLKQYRQVNGHCRVPQRYKVNPQLGNWVRDQRQFYKKNKLLPQQIKSLEGIGFKWVLEKQENNVSWDERFSQLKQYKEQNGHCRVPQKYKANTQLGDWVSKQRQKYKKNKLLPGQIKSLEGIGFVWVPPRGRRRS